MSKRKPPAKRKTIARRGPPRRPLSAPTASPLGSMRMTLEQLRLDPVLFADIFLPNNEKGEPWRLSRHQRRVLGHMFKRAYRLRVWGEMKKSGKTFLAAVLLIWWAFTHANTEIIVAANDLEQAQSRVFQTAVALIRHNPALVKLVKVQAGKLRFFNGTLATAIAADYKGAAGSRHSLYIIDEPWGIMEECQRGVLRHLHGCALTPLGGSAGQAVAQGFRRVGSGAARQLSPSDHSSTPKS